MKNKIPIAILFLSLLSIFRTPGIHGSEFIFPSKQHINEVTLDKIKYDLRGKGVGLDYRELFDKAIAEENIGFMGYHGDSLEFLVYQDVIRIIVEEILEIPVKKDFHFVSTPLRMNDSLQSLEGLSGLFVKGVYYSQIVVESTFPLNFAMYSNHNRLGLNTVLNFSKNAGDGANLQRKELQYMFESLGMDSALLEVIYDISHQYLDSKAGILLQVFDNSIAPYGLGNAVGYASYPNGFIAENRLISEYFLDSHSADFPQELRLVLGVSGILNPTSPITIKRYTKIQPGKLKAWEQELRGLILSSSFDSIKRDALRQNLLHVWNN
ncbi:hypothetical protein PHSC3_001668 [Chlamydiales bacterium STE3]|nr:hypothetical protein PHSC3_001668 [Chlamydiales bacterium STE3]